jgi:hypothetical protein
VVVGNQLSSKPWSRATLTGDFPLDMFAFYRIQAAGVSRSANLALDGSGAAYHRVI